MRQQLDERLARIMEVLRQMGEEVEISLKEALDCLVSTNKEKAETIIKNDQRINDLERQVDDECVRVIATQQPVAKDLRKVIAAMKISTDLERMADLAVDVAKVVRRIDGPLMKPLIDIPKMAELAIEMTRQGLIAYINEDVEIANKLATDDDQVDALYNRVVRELLELMTNNPETLNQGMYLAFVGRYIERIADHATNIGESVVYIATADRKDLNF